MTTLTTHSSPAPAAPASVPAPTPAPDLDVPAIVDETVRLLSAHYPPPDVAEQLSVLLRRRLAEGAYDVGAAEELSALITADLRSVNGDPRLRLTYDPGSGDAPRLDLAPVP
ncbi:hypothetical protein ACIQOU_07740 [Streptomyces sp. NPDC091279]|uniref:hypothetical protein n=1 Tax=unclassified Streptomyces TaxID=2593676 RepID=UPI00382D3E86